jgi:hypothetical protein
MCNTHERQSCSSPCWNRSPHQRHLLEWFVLGYTDTEVAVQLGTTPHAVRQARYSTYAALRPRRAC